MDYTLYLGEDVAAWLATQPLQVEQLVWVCKSKGIKNKKKKKKNRHRQQEDHPRQDEHFQQQQRQQQEQELQQRIEPFLRARILSLDEEDEKYEDNQKDDEKHKQIQHTVDCNSTTTTTNENNNYKNNNTKKMGNDRVTVIYPKGSIYRVRRSHLWPILDPSWSYYPWLLLDSSSSVVVVVSAETLPKSDLEQQQVDGALAVASTTTTTQNNLNSSSSSFWTNQIRTMDQTYHLSNNINNNSSTRVLVRPETNEYRRCCIQHTLLLPNMDFFVEVGCDYGTTVAKVASTLSHEDSSCSGSNNGCHEGRRRRHRHPSSNCCRVLGIDKSTESIAMAKQRYPHLLFVQWDLLDDNNNKSQGEDTTTAAAAMNQLQQNVKNQRNSHQAVDAVGPHDNDNNTIPSSLTTTAFTMKSLALPLVAQYLLQLQQLWTTTTTTDTATNGTTRLNKCSNETTTSISSNDKDKNNQNEKENNDVDHDDDDDECLSSSSLVVAIDINGNRELEAVQQCLARVQSMWQPRLIIVKSRALHQYISQNS